MSLHPQKSSLGKLRLTEYPCLLHSQEIIFEPPFHAGKNPDRPRQRRSAASSWMRDCLDGGKEKAAPQNQPGSSQADGLASRWLLNEKQHSSILPVTSTISPPRITCIAPGRCRRWREGMKGKQDYGRGGREQNEEEEEGGGRTSEKKGEGKVVREGNRKDFGEKLRSTREEIHLRERCLTQLLFI